MCASWDGKQSCFGEFLFLLHKKIIFHFLNAKNGFFVKRLPKICSKNGPTQF
jgi:hypothetical protein